MIKLAAVAVIYMLIAMPTGSDAHFPIDKCKSENEAYVKHSVALEMALIVIATNLKGKVARKYTSKDPFKLISEYKQSVFILLECLKRPF